MSFSGKSKQTFHKLMVKASVMFKNNREQFKVSRQIIVLVHGQKIQKLITVQQIIKQEFS